MSSTPRVAGTIRSKNPLKGAVEIIPERLYYAALKTPPPSHNILASTPRRNKADPPAAKKQIHFFNIDNELVYWNFFLDFGPLNLGQLMRFSNKLNDKLRKFPVVCYYSNTVPAKRANAIFLICAWQMIYMNRSPDEAYQGFDAKHIKVKDGTKPPVSTSQGAVTIQPLPPFHDASPCACTYDLSVMDCLEGMAKARSCGFWDHETFDIDEYEYFEQVENGDLNWLVKDKILAFAGPSFERHVSPEGYCTLAPSDYIPYFQRKNVGLVVRLNKRLYNEQDFIDAGIDHVDAFFLDGSCPPMKILYQVLEHFEALPKEKAFAVHCKAGLGRTGTCIGAYLMKHYRFTAAEVIAWMRICRPGCVIGPQQHFLEQIQNRMWQEGELAHGGVPKIVGPMGTEATENDDDAEDRNKDNCRSDRKSRRKHSSRNGESGSMDADMEAVQGRAGQAEGLLAARAKAQQQHRQQQQQQSPSDGAGEEDEAAMNLVPMTPEQTAKNSAVVPVVTPDHKSTSSTGPSQLWCG